MYVNFDEGSEQTFTPIRFIATNEYYRGPNDPSECCLEEKQSSLACHGVSSETTQHAGYLPRRNITARERNAPVR